MKRTRRGEWSKKPESDINEHFAERDILKDAADKSRVTKRNTGIRSDVSVEEKEQKWIMITVTRESMNMSGKKWHFVQAIGLCNLRRLFSRLYEVTEHEDNKTVVYCVFRYSEHILANEETLLHLTRENYVKKPVYAYYGGSVVCGILLINSGTGFKDSG